jgi:hypothetical protein
MILGPVLCRLRFAWKATVSSGVRSDCRLSRKAALWVQQLSTRKTEGAASTQLVSR